MGKKNYSAATVSHAVKLANTIGLTNAARQCDVPRTTLKYWVSGGGGYAVDESPVEEAKETKECKELEIAGLKAQLANLRGETAFDGKSEWKHVEQENEKRIENFEKLSRVTGSIPTSKPIGLVFGSDFHITSGMVDLRRLREDAELIAETDGVYFIGVGDFIENAVKHRSTVVARNISPTREMELFDYWLSIVSEKVIAMVSGNHDAFTMQLSGQDALGKLAAKRAIHYTPDELNLNLTIGSVNYKVMVRHQTRYNSVMNPAHGLFRHLDYCANDPWDCGVSGHHHTSAVDMRWKLGAKRVAVRPGSYQIHSAYSRQYGFPYAEPKSPMVIFWPNERMMAPFDCLRTGAQVLRGLRS